jgi:hypothetical protein
MVDVVKSRAVVEYIGRGRSPFPMADPDAVLNMDVPGAEALLRYVRGLVAEMFELFPVHWRGDQDDLDLHQATGLVRSAMLDRHADLDPSAADALVWMWSYSAWK